jgi:hypothetical protein
MTELLNTSIAGNDLVAWLKAMLWVVAAVGVMRGLMPMVIVRLAAWADTTAINWDNALVNALRATRWSLIALAALGPASQELTLGPVAERWLHGLAMVAVSIQAGVFQRRPDQGAAAQLQVHAGAAHHPQIRRDL